MIVVSRHSINCFFFLLSLGKKAQSYSLEERKRILETFKEIVKINQSSNEPVTCHFAGLCFERILK